MSTKMCDQILKRGGQQTGPLNDTSTPLLFKVMHCIDCFNYGDQTFLGVTWEPEEALSPKPKTVRES